MEKNFFDIYKYKNAKLQNDAILNIFCKSFFTTSSYKYAKAQFLFRPDRYYQGNKQKSSPWYYQKLRQRKCVS